MHSIYNWFCWLNTVDTLLNMFNLQQQQVNTSLLKIEPLLTRKFKGEFTILFSGFISIFNALSKQKYTIIQLLQYNAYSGETGKTEVKFTFRNTIRYNRCGCPKALVLAGEGFDWLPICEPVKKDEITTTVIRRVKGLIKDT